MKLLRDTWLVFGRYFWIFTHNPAWVVIGVVQPLLYLILFAPLLKPLASIDASQGPPGLSRPRPDVHPAPRRATSNFQSDGFRSGRCSGARIRPSGS